MKPEKQISTIPRKPLIWLALAMLFIVPPMFGNLAPWVPLFFLIMLLAKFYLEWRGVRLRSTVVKLGVAIAGIGGVALSYQSLIGAEPSLSVCLILFAIKIIEAHTAREFHILVALGWFLCLAQLIISQDLTPALCSLLAFAFVLASVVQFHRGNSPARTRFTSLRAAFALILQALPLVIALFFLFPRGSGGFRFVLNRAYGNRTGMSDSLSPGSISSLALSNEAAFRVEFPDGDMPAASNLYWRGGVFSSGRGMSWMSAKSDALWHPPEGLGGVGIRQRIILQPHGGRWIFALDRPARAPRGTRMVAGSVLLADQAVYSAFLYEVTSRTASREVELPSRERKTCLQLPNDVSPQIRALVQSWTSKASDSRTVVSAAMRYFHDQNFKYSLSPGEYGPNALDEFMFVRRSGFCEHYAAAFATLMRVAGIPSRVVVGYQGGEFNSLGNYLLVRQSDAHAWCEIWAQGKGWERVDPTLVVAPERVKMGFASFMELRGKTGAGATVGDPAQLVLARHGFFHSMQLAWDTLGYEWNTHVSGFDEDAQRSLLQSFGIINRCPFIMFGWASLIAAVLLGGQFLSSWWNSRAKPDITLVLYRRFCQRLGTLGVVREPSEGPRQYADRAMRQFPALADEINGIADLYIALRYAPEPGNATTENLARRIKAFRKIKASR